MKAVALFEKVSFQQFYKDLLDAFKANSAEISVAAAKEYYDSIQRPRRATDGSGGFDFYIPLPVFLATDAVLVVPTGIRCRIDEGYTLDVMPKSGLGFKYRLRLCNTIGLIDQDYYYSDNEGHILVKLSNESWNGACIDFKQGDKFCQGTFREYFVTYDDEPVERKRNGGFGSTGN